MQILKKLFSTKLNHVGQNAVVFRSGSRRIKPRPVPTAGAATWWMEWHDNNTTIPLPIYSESFTMNSCNCLPQTCQVTKLRTQPTKNTPCTLSSTHALINRTAETVIRWRQRDKTCIVIVTVIRNFHSPRVIPVGCSTLIVATVIVFLPSRSARNMPALLAPWPQYKYLNSKYSDRRYQFRQYQKF